MSGAETDSRIEGVLDVCAVAHTHWDREWYHSAAVFRQRLVALVDALLEPTAPTAPGVSSDGHGTDGSADPAPDHAERQSAPFLLDGQAIILEDYLSMRTDRESAVRQLLQSGAIEAGPWYVLADGLIPSGEAIVQNLLIGRETLARFGATAPRVLYCPDTFGHPAALPLIAAGFAFPVAVVWRGYGGFGAAPGDTFRWQSAAGDEVVTYHLPPDGYEYGSALPTTLPLSRERWARMRDMLARRSTTGVALLPVGADHHAAQPDAATALELLAEASRDDMTTRARTRAVTLSEFARALHAAAAHRADMLPVVTGELRNSYGYTWTLGGTLATRAMQKRANARAERALLRDAMPWSVLAWLHGGARALDTATDGHITLAQHGVLTSAAWRTLLRAHPHDTLCGCSIDAVARAMDERVATARAEARGLRESALAIALGHDPVAARARPVATGALVVRNRSAHMRGGVAEVTISETLADVPVGPASGADLALGSETQNDMVRGSDPARSAGGAGSGTAVSLPGAMCVQHLGSRVVHRRRESPQHYPDNDLVREYRVLVWVPAVPALGVAVVPLAQQAATGARAPSHAGNDNNALPLGVSRATCSSDGDDIVIANGVLTVRAAVRGVTIERAGRRIENALAFETAQDVGDSYTPAIRGEPELLVLRAVDEGQSGPLRASVRLRFATSHPARGVQLTATLSLDAGSEHLRIDVEGVNRRRDHRLRLVVRTDVPDDATRAVWADAAFGRVRREPIVVPEHAQRAERVVPGMPMHRWVGVFDDVLGAVLHADGLAEVEALGGGRIALTQLRAIGELSRNDLPERPGHAGWPAPIPRAQSQGRFRARIGVSLHGAITDTVWDEVERVSDALLLPLVGTTWRDLEPARARELPGPMLDGASLRVSRVALAVDGDGIVLRCVNDADVERRGAWTLPDGGAYEVARSRLDETVLGPWRRAGHVVEMRVPARGVETLRVRRVLPGHHR